MEEGEDQLHISMEDFTRSAGVLRNLLNPCQGSLQAAVLNMSVQTRSTPYADMADLEKKRKLLSVELDLPETKYKCVELEGNCDTVNLVVEWEALINDRKHIFDTLQVESAKDSNSFADDSDTAMSACADVNNEYGPAIGKDIASTSAQWPNCGYPRVMLFSSDGTKELISERSGRNSYVVLGCHGESSHECELQMRQMLEEQLVDLGVDLTYGCSDYANACQEFRANKEVEDCNLSSVHGSTNFILSSGRSSVNNEPLNSTKRPTIDKEFEEYFSMLMM